MCQDCGCADTNITSIDGKIIEARDHDLDEINHAGFRKISIMENILQKNNHIAAHNRELFNRLAVFCLNWISAPGSGKTALLERLIKDKRQLFTIAVIEGDQHTENDADRIRRAGVKAVQINTDSACHLDAAMIRAVLVQLELGKIRLLCIENIGNLVCPTAFDLGEHQKIAVISCPEGEDKPLKYPDLFLASEVLLINKIDLIPYLDFNLAECVGYAKRVNPKIEIFPVSAKTGEGLSQFYEWIETRMPQPRV